MAAKESNNIKRGKLSRFDARKRTVKPKESPFVWTFYESPDTFMLDDIIHARMKFNTYFDCNFFHFGRKTKTGNVCQVSFSTFEAHSILDFLDEILAQIDSHKLPKKPGDSLIPFFQDQPEERAFMLEKDDAESFWLTPDLTLTSVRCRLSFNRQSGAYVLYINSPISSELSKEHHGWQGPTLQFNVTSMRMLQEFLKEGLQKCLHDTQDDAD